MPTVEQFIEIDRLLKAGKLNEAADLARSSAREAQDALDLAAGKQLEPPPPRPTQVIFNELMEAIVSHLGNRHEMITLLAEYRSSLA